MSPDPSKTVAFYLGELKAQMSDVLKDTSEIKSLCATLETRVTSLEGARFRAYTVLTTISAIMGAIMGFIGSHIKESLQWMTQAPPGAP